MPKKDKQKSKTNSWSKAGTFTTFAEADAKRNKIAESENMQTKVRRRHADDTFTVHYRKVPKTAEK